MCIPPGKILGTPLPVTITKKFVLLQAFNVQTGDWLELPLESRYLTYNTVYRYYVYEE
jgi:hypothetical protein